MNDYGNGMGGGMDDGAQEPDNDDELLQELLQAAQAGDDAEGEGFFAPVEGADQGDGGGTGDMKLEASGISPEQLQQLLEALKSGGAGGM